MGAILKSYGGHFEIIGGSFLSHRGVIFETSRGHFWFMGCSFDDCWPSPWAVFVVLHTCFNTKVNKQTAVRSGVIICLGMSVWESICFEACLSGEVSARASACTGCLVTSTKLFCSFWFRHLHV